jgi:PEP-CTERM motif
VSSALTDRFFDEGVKQGDGEIAIAPFPVPVPEPSTWAMMLAGFTGLSAMALRRKRKVKPT